MMLFDETEGVVKTRPITITSQQHEKLYLELAQEIIDNDYSSGNVNVIAEDLDNLSSTEGFEMAKELQEDGTARYTFSGDFVTFLEDIYHRKREILIQNIKLWAKANKPMPKLSIGQKLLIKKPLPIVPRVEDTIYIISLNLDTAEYIVNSNPKGNGGYIVAYEEVEEGCEIIP